MPAQTLNEAVLGEGIRPKHWRQGEPQHGLLCPKCSGGRSGEKSLSLTIDADGQGAVWTCHRASCGWTNNIVLGDRKVLPFREQPRKVIKPAPVEKGEKTRNQRLYEVCEKRAIIQATVDAFGVYLTHRHFEGKADQPAGIYPAIVYPYLFNGEETNRKYRGPNKIWTQEPHHLPTLFNIDSVVDDEHIVFVEGENDVLACYDAGWKQTVTLPTGAPKARFDDNGNPLPEKSGRRYDALGTHADR